MLRTIGLMSGTSLDGVDAAYLETDGEAIARFGPRQTLPYDPSLRRALRALLDRAESLTPDDPALLDATRRLTERHAEAVEAIGLPADLVGFHGQTILHRPAAQGRIGTPLTWQIGDAALLARRTGMSVAYDFRSADVAAGGQGAPLVPVFHRALAAPLPKPLAILNLGGVGNVTWLGPDGEMLAFDTGPANGPLDDWARQHTGKDYDAAGKLALAGQADGAVLGRLMAHPYLAAPPPKSGGQPFRSGWRSHFGGVLRGVRCRRRPAFPGTADAMAGGGRRAAQSCAHEGAWRRAGRTGPASGSRGLGWRCAGSPGFRRFSRPRGARPAAEFPRHHRRAPPVDGRADYRRTVVAFCRGLAAPAGRITWSA